jgi:hypothetical protein
MISRSVELAVRPLCKLSGRIPAQMHP